MIGGLIRQEYFAILVIIVMGVGFVTEIVPVSVMALLACLSFAIAGIIPFHEAFSGFGSDTVMLIMGSMIVGTSLARTGCAETFGKAVIRVIGYHERLVLGVFMLMGGVISMFVSNSGTMAMLIPVITSVAASSNGLIKTKNILLPVGMAVLVGGSSTLVGSAPQLVSQGFLESNGLRTMSMFELAIPGIPALLAITLFFLTVGFNLLRHETRSIPERPLILESQENETKSTRKMILALVILLCMIAGFLSHIWTIGTVAVLSGMVCIGCRLVKAKDAYKSVDWSSIIIISSCFGISKGLAASGGAAFLADTILELLGSGGNAFTLIFATAVFYFVMASIMSHTALLALSLPLFVPLASHFNIDTTMLVYAMTCFVCSGYMTPLGAASYSMTMVEGYAFSSYIKLGFFPNIICYLIILCVLFLRMGM